MNWNIPNVFTFAQSISGEVDEFYHMFLLCFDYFIVQTMEWYCDTISHRITMKNCRYYLWKRGIKHFYTFYNSYPDMVFIMREIKLAHCLMSPFYSNGNSTSKYRMGLSSACLFIIWQTLWQNLFSSFFHLHPHFVH